MSSEEADVEALVRRIRTIFGGLQFPGRERAIDDQNDDEGLELLDAFGERHWSELPARSLMTERAGLFWLSPEGYRFYLPAYLTASLTATKEQGRADITDYTVMSLGPHDGTSRS